MGLKHFSHSNSLAQSHPVLLSLPPHCLFSSPSNRTPVSFKDDRTRAVALYSEAEPHVGDARAAPQTLCHQVREE